MYRFERGGRTWLAGFGPTVGPALMAGAILEFARPHGDDVTAAFVLLGACLLVGAWVKFVALPFLTRGMLPSGRTVNDIRAQRLETRRKQAERQEQQFRRHEKYVAAYGQTYRFKPKHARPRQPGTDRGG